VHSSSCYGCCEHFVIVFYAYFFSRLDGRRTSRMGCARVFREYNNNNCTLAKSCRRRRLLAAHPHYGSVGGGGMQKSGAVLSRGNRIINPWRRSRAGGICRVYICIICMYIIILYTFVLFDCYCLGGSRRSCECTRREKNERILSLSLRRRIVAEKKRN